MRHLLSREFKGESVLGRKLPVGGRLSYSARPFLAGVLSTRHLPVEASILDDDDEDTRVEVLIGESIVPAVVEERTRGRRVTSGLWVGKYTGTVTTSPSGFQIDHLVPLKEAHESGGHAWSEEQRRNFANDLDDAVALIAVRGGANGSKGARDPAEWMPPNRAYWCEYLESWVAVKQKYELSIDPEEASALREGFRVCGRYKSGDKLEGRH